MRVLLFAIGWLNGCVLLTEKELADKDLRLSDDPVPVDDTGSPVDPAVTLSPLAPGTDDTLTAEVVGTGDHELAYTWLVDDTDVGIDHNTLDGQVHFNRGQAIQLVVSSADGAAPWASLTSDTLVVVNTPSTLDGVTLEPTTPVSGDTLLCGHDDATDPDNDEITYTYEWTVDDENVAVGDGSLDPAYFSRSAIVGCFVTPSDGLDDGATAASPLVVVQNSPPSVVSVSISPDGPTVEDSLLCEYTGFADPDGDSDESTFSWSINGAYAGSGSSLASGFIRGDEVSCVVTPHDGMDAGPPLSATVNVENSAPSVASVTVGPDPAYAGDALECTWSGYSDADGHADASTVEWFVNEETSGSGSTFSGSFVHGDTLRCAVTPNDGFDSGASVSSELVVSNTVPVISGSVTVSPDPPHDGISLSCAASGLSDADGEPVTASYSWRVGEVVAGTATMLGSDSFARGDAVMCSAVPHDGTDAGLDVSSAWLTVGNATPVVTEVAVSPVEFRTDDTVSVGVVAATDADGDPVVSYRYAWLVNGELVGEAGESLDGAVHFDRGDLVSVRAWASDADGEGEAFDSAAVDVLNTAPDAPGSLTVTLQDDGALVCTMELGAGDADGDTLTYAVEWELDGVTHDGALASTVWADDTVPAESVEDGNAWLCRVAAFDGESIGGEASALWVGARQAISISQNTGCFIDSGGELRCWFYSMSSLDDQAHKFDGVYVDVATFENIICALDSSGRITCGNWYNLEGQFTPPSEDFFVSISAQDGDSWDDSGKIFCGLTSTGVQQCWGEVDSLSKHCEEEVLLDTYPPVCDAPVVLESVSAGPGYACGVEPGGEAICWGAGTNGGGVYYGGGGFPPLSTFPTSPVVNVSTGPNNLCWVMESGALECRGLPLGSYDYVMDPWASIPGDYVAANVTDHTLCAIGRDGSVSCWGRWAGGNCELTGRGPCADWTTGGSTAEYFVKPIPDKPFQSLGCHPEGQWCCGIGVDGELECWGTTLMGDGYWSSLPDESYATWMDFESDSTDTGVWYEGDGVAVSLSTADYGFVPVGKVYGEIGRTFSGGDVDGDGLSDLLISDSSNLTLTLAASLGAMGEHDLSESGYQFRPRRCRGGEQALADINGDDFADIVISGESICIGGADLSEQVGVFSGADLEEGLDLYISDADHIILDVAGTNVSSMGDMDGDGLDDLLIGGGSGVSEPVLFLGSTVSGATDLTASDADAVFTMAWSATISGVGDVDGDGVADIHIGSGTSAGEDSGTYLFSGASVLADFEVDEESANYVFVSADNRASLTAQGRGDVDSDGRTDLLIGAPSSSEPMYHSGIAYLVLASSLSGSGTFDLDAADYAFFGEARHSKASTSIAMAGDVDGDGFGDFLIGAPYSQLGGSIHTGAAPAAGKAYLILGADLGEHARISLSAANYEFTGEDIGDIAGFQVAGVGDVNGDDLDDIMIGAPREPRLGSSGKAYLLLLEP